MADSKVLRIIDDMSDYVDSHNAGPLSRDKIKISKDELFNYIDRLRQTLPTELEEAYKITKAKNEILKAAKNKAARIEAEAEEQLREIVKEDEIVLAAEKEAEFIIEDAEKEADSIIKEAEDTAAQIKIGALSYAEEMLATVEKMISHNLDTTISSSNIVIETLKSNLEIIQNNRSELNAQILESKEVNNYNSEDDEMQADEEMDEKFAVDVSNEDFEDDDEDFASDNDGKALDESEEEDDDDELYDFTKKFPFKKDDR